MRGFMEATLSFGQQKVPWVAELQKKPISLGCRKG